MIVKIQRPLMTNEDEPMALIYDQSRAFLTQYPYTAVESLFEDGSLKVYHLAKLVGTELEIGVRVKDQEW